LLSFFKNRVKGEMGMTLHEAMKTILLEQMNQTMHYEALAVEIAERGLYRQKKGEIAYPKQIKARAKRYPHIFAVDGENNHYISLR
jgi:hypothetical protein